MFHIARSANRFGIKRAPNATTALGQKRKSRFRIAMSAITPKADINRSLRHVRFVPIGDIARLI
jgi:hypothetical protein